MSKELLHELKAIRAAIENLTFPAPTQRWGDIGQAAQLYGLSPATLRRCINDLDYPPPCKRVRGKWLFDLHRMHDWVLGYPDAQRKQRELVDELLREVLDVHETN